MMFTNLLRRLFLPCVALASLLFPLFKYSHASNFIFKKLISNCTFGDVIAWGSQNILLNLEGDRIFCWDHLIRFGIFTDELHLPTFWIDNNQYLDIINKLMHQAIGDASDCDVGETSGNTTMARSFLTIVQSALTSKMQCASEDASTNLLSIAPINRYLLEVLAMGRAQNTSQLVFGIDESEASYTGK